MSRWMWFLPAAALASLAGCGGSMHSADEKYYLVSAATKMEYWDEAASGVAQAGKQLGVIAQAVGPETYDTKGEHEQFRALLSKKPTGIAVSAGDPATLKDDIDAAIAQGIPVITMDSDAPNSKRLFFIGTDNYKAGLMGGRLVASHLGGKGNVVIFTFPEQPNLKERLQGYRDIFAEHPGIHITEIVDAKGDPGVIFDRTMQAAPQRSRGPPPGRRWPARVHPAGSPGTYPHAHNVASRVISTAKGAADARQAFHAKAVGQGISADRNVGFDQLRQGVESRPGCDRGASSRVRSGSTRRGAAAARAAQATLTWCSGEARTALRVTSDPVPAVVGTAINGQPDAREAGPCRSLPGNRSGRRGSPKARRWLFLRRWRFRRQRQPPSRTFPRGQAPRPHVLSPPRALRGR